MTPINRMECPVVPQSVAEVDLLDVEIQECPYPAYRTLREQAPVYRDKLTGFYVLTRYEDLREVLKDPATFSNLRPRGPDHIPPERVQRIANLFREKGWLPFIYAHLFSGAQWQRLTYLLNQRLEKEAA